MCPDRNSERQSFESLNLKPAPTQVSSPHAELLLLLRLLIVITFHYCEDDNDDDYCQWDC